MRTKDLENQAVPAIMETIKSGKATLETLAIFQTQLLVGILMALNDQLAMMSQPPKQFINAYSLPIID
jgi:hypothetical protein